MAVHDVEEDWSEVRLGTSEAAEEGVVLMRTQNGGVVMLPKSLRDLRGEALEVTQEIQDARAQMHELQARVDVLVETARDLGLSWNAIGWCVGTTGDAARRRWGAGSDE
jgi:hypothetical protein